MADELKLIGMRVTVDDRNEKLGYRVREAQTKKIPVELVVGDNELNNHSVTLRRYGQKQETKLTFEEAKELLLGEIRSKK